MGPFFKEFTIRYLGNAKNLADFLLSHNIIFGYKVEESFEGMENVFLVAVTEKRTKKEIDLLADLIGKFNG